MWGGRTYQFPLYEPFFVAPVLTAMGALRFFRDGKGRVAIERGIDQVRGSRRRVGGLRVLAFVGFINLISLATYAVPMNLIGLHVDPFPEAYPTYLVNDLCGETTDYACPDPELPLPVRGGQPVKPLPPDE